MTQVKYVLDPKKVTHSPVSSPGCVYKKCVILDLKNVYENPQANNPVRSFKTKDEHHIGQLVASLENGIDYSKMPPVVRECSKIVNGKHYTHELICGHHRFEAFSNLGIESWVFWVYDFAQNGYSYDDSLRTFQLQENDHVAALPSSISDVANTISRLIKDGSKLVENTEDSIRAYVDTYCKNMHPQTKAKIVRQTMSLAGTYRAIITYTAKDAREWIDTNTDYTHDGIYDPKRKAFGWSVKEGYDYDAIVNAIKKYSLEGKESYFVLHTKSPTAKSTIHDKRESLMSAFTAWETYLVDVVEYYNENGHFPWHVEAFLPQDQENEDSKELVSVDDYI